MILVALSAIAALLYVIWRLMDRVESLEDQRDQLLRIQGAAIPRPTLPSKQASKDARIKLPSFPTAV
jgi:hypothetical protein